MTSHHITTGDVSNSNVVAGNVSKSTLSGGGNKPEKHKPVEKPFILMCVGVAVLIGSLILSLFGVEFNPTGATLVRLITAGCMCPYFGTMAGKTFVSIKSEKGEIPFHITATGMFAIFVAMMILLWVMNIPSNGNPVAPAQTKKDIPTAMQPY